MKPNVFTLTKFIFAFSAAAIISSCGSNNANSNNTNGDTTNNNSSANSKQAVANITGTKQDSMAVNGTATFDAQDNGQVKMVLDLTIPQKANQTVAVHIHEHGDCGDAGNNSHGHWNPTNKPHGKWGTGDFHSGDIGNVALDAQGKGSITITTDLWSIGGDEKTNILDKAIIVHGGVDDYTSQPSGNAGPRIGCGVIEEKM